MDKRHHLRALLLLLLLFPALLPAQSLEQRRDSLRSIAHSPPSDSLRAEALNALANSYLHEDPSKMLLYARQALHISEGLELDILTGRSVQKVGIAHMLLGQTDSAQAELQRADALFRKAGHLKGRIEALTNLANMLYSTGEYVAAEERILELYGVLDQYDPEGKRPAYRIGPMILIGNIQTSTGRYEEAVHNFREALHVATTTPGQAPKVPYIVNNLSSVFSQHLGQPDSALHYLEDAVSSPHLDRNVQARIDISINIGDLYHSEYGNGREAMKWYGASLALVEESGILIQKPSILLRMANLEMEWGNLSQAEALIGDARSVADNKMDFPAVMRALRLQVRLDSMQGNLAGALSGQRAWYAMEDSLIGAEKQVEIQELQQRIALIEKDFEIRELEREREYERRRSVLWAIIGIVVVLLLGGVGLYQYLLMRKGRSLAKAEAELHGFQEAMLKQELEFKSQRLVDFATHLSVKKQLVEEIMGEIRTHAVGPARESLQQLLRRIQPQLRLDADQKELELYMERTHQNFLLALTQRYEGLTKGEKRLAAMVRTGLSGKEIATLLGINAKSVEMNRYRLRKKLGLSPEEDLKACLDEISLEA